MTPRISRITPVDDPPAESAAVVMDAMREAGIDPRRHGNAPAVKKLWQRWIDGEITREQFIGECRRLHA